MPNTLPKRVSLAIGISSAPPLPFLRGALNGARDFRNWAQSEGYQSEMLTDEKDPVTLDTLRKRLETILSEATPGIPRFILYFAGHGLIREAEDGLWLLSDWNKELRAVAFEVLKRRLYMYGIQQISIFADACRSLPADMNTADLVPDAVLGRGPVKPTATPDIDKFIATQDGATTFAIPGPTPAADCCIFTRVLMEGLWGISPSAISSFFPGKVTSQSLAQYLKTEVPRRAQTYNRTLNPSLQPLFPLGSDVYFGDIVPAPVPPVFLPWPNPSAVLGQGPEHGTLQFSEPEIQEVRESELSDSPHYRRGAAPMHHDYAAPEHDARVPEHHEHATHHAYAGEHDHGQAAHHEHAMHHAPVGRVPPSPNPGEVLQARIRTQKVPTSFETGSGLAVGGVSIHAVWLAPEFSTASEGGEDWWQVGSEPKGYLARPAQVLIETEEGGFLAATALPQLIASCVCEAKGTQAIVYRGPGGEGGTGELAAEAISHMESGSLRADAVSQLTTRLRELKHVDPTLGVC